jgi:hypothetical protein
MGKVNPDPEEWTYGDSCQCGCGNFPKGEMSRFLPGHDAKLRRCVECGTPITGRSDRRTCSAKCRVALSRRLGVKP